MVEVKSNFSGGLDMDSSLYKVAQNAYVDAYNVKRVSNETNNNAAFTTIVGNRLVTYALPAGTSMCIGAIANTDRNTIIYFVYNSNGNHLILEYNNSSRTVTPILINLTDTAGVDILGFTAAGKITSINILNRTEGDILSWLDSLDRPSELNITRFKAGQYLPISRDIIDVAKKPPLTPLVNVYQNDVIRRSNNLQKKLFRFKYRYKYDDFQTSVCSPIAELPYPVSPLSATYNSEITNNNRISLTMLAGAKNVSKIEILMSYVEGSNDWSDFALVDAIDNKIWAEGDAVPYLFYNDSTYPTIPVTESIQQFDYVPDGAKAQDLVNGNVYVYGHITEGYDRVLTPNLVLTPLTTPLGGGASTGGISYTLTIIKDTASQQIYNILFSGTAAGGTNFLLKQKRVNNGAIETMANYTTPAGVTTSASTVAQEIENLFMSAANNGIGFAQATGDNLYVKANDDSGQYKRVFDSLVITPPAATAPSSNSTASFPFSESRRIAIRYRDKWGKTNDILYNDKVTFPAYIESAGAVSVPYINAKIYHLAPDWAYSYDWLMTKINTFYKYWLATGVRVDTKFIYFDISNFAATAIETPTTSKVLSYSFKDGDRMRLIKRESDGLVFNDTHDAAIIGVVVDPLIAGVIQKGTFIKIRREGVLATGMDYSSQRFIIKMYSPSQQNSNAEKEFFFEFGQSYKILNPGTANRVHAGMFFSGVPHDQTVGLVTPAEFNFYNGDAYFRTRTISSATATASFYVQDQNFVDTQITGVNNIDGRPGVIDVNAKKATYEATVRFGGAYQANTNINGLNRFYELNYDEYDLSYGGIMRLKVRDRAMRVYQKYKVGNVPLFSEIRKNAGSGNVTVVSDKLLNPIGYFAGNYGIGNCPESLASFSFADYFCDNINSVICRVSNNGIEPISVLYKVNSFASRELPPRGATYKVYGVCDPTDQNNYVMAMEATASLPAVTMSFEEGTNSFEDKLAFQPEMMVAINTLLVSFKNGALYTHDSPTYNNFYGVQYDSYVDMVFNTQALMKKQPMAITEVASQIWDCPVITTSSFSYGTTPQLSELKTVDFVNDEGEFKAALLRDSNSVDGLLEGDFLKGEFCKIRFRITNTTNLVSLNIVSLKWNGSPNNPA